MRKNSKLRNRTLTEKLTKKLTWIYSIIYLCLFIFLLTVLLPLLYNDVTQKKKEYSALIFDQYKDILTICQGDLNYLASIPSLSNLLRTQSLKQDVQSAALIEQALQSYSSCYERIKLILIEDENGTIMQTFTNSHSDALNTLLNDENYDKLKREIYSTYYSNVYPLDIWFTKKSYSISVSQRYSIYNHKYIFTIFYDVDDYLKNSKLICDKDFTDYAVFTKDFQNYV